MSLTPFTRDDMRSLKPQYDEKNRRLKVEKTIEIIYKAAVAFATYGDCNRYEMKIDMCVGVSVSFIEANMTEILSGLQKLFPDCLIEYKILDMPCRGCIIIDWS